MACYRTGGYYSLRQLYLLRGLLLGLTSGVPTPRNYFPDMDIVSKQALSRRGIDSARLKSKWRDMAVGSLAIMMVSQSADPARIVIQER